MIRVVTKQVVTYHQLMIDQVDVGDLVFKILHHKPISNLVKEDSYDLDTIQDLSVYSNYMPTIKIYDNDRLLWDNLNGYAKL